MADFRLRVLAYPLVLREGGPGTLEVVEMALRKPESKLGDLRVVFYLDNTEAIRGCLAAAPGALGFVSRRALARERAAGGLEIVPIEGLRLPRHFEAVWVQGQPLPRAVQRLRVFGQEPARTRG